MHQKISGSDVHAFYFDGGNRMYYFSYFEEGKLMGFKVQKHTFSPPLNLPQVFASRIDFFCVFWHANIVKGT